MANRLILIAAACINLAYTSCQHSRADAPVSTVTVDAAVSDYPEKQTKSPVKTGYDRVIEAALSQVGVIETSTNWSPEIKQYLGTCGITYPAYWCAGFANWCHITAGVGHPEKSACWCPSWFANSKTYWIGSKNHPVGAVPGTTAGYYFPSLKRIAHIGIYWREENNAPVVIEGNTSASANSRNGDRVAVKYRQWHEIDRISDWIK